ncbi:futalosine hydrolase [Paraflavitalea pollutisoli]|uniref:futalosine hydrolase n=1 Tax=Paraflavitalea pollutisoli TaxID=3034143 RepID=UPI0023EC19BE|nr:futalosine hydrolase [Paraflavitalea sp. H1-2-19X]
MHILLTAATTFEIQPVTDYLKQPDQQGRSHTFHTCITGIGMMATTWQLAQSIRQQRPDYIIQAGIAGSFSPHFPPGRVVIVEREIVGDLGVEENGRFKDIFEMGLQREGNDPAAAQWLINPTASNWEGQGLALVRGVTINEISTRPARIEHFQQNLSATVETMEGAALHYVGLQEDIPFVQLRSISNFVGIRDKQQWKMKEAITALNEQLINILKTL